MKSVRQLARRWFGKTEQSHSGNGLFATPEELMEQRRYTAYLRNPQTRLATSAYAGDVKSAFKGRGIDQCPFLLGKIRIFAPRKAFFVANRGIS